MFKTYCLLDDIYVNIYANRRNVALLVYLILFLSLRGYGVCGCFIHLSSVGSFLYNYSVNLVSNSNQVTHRC